MRYFTSSDLAGFCGVDGKTINNWANRGRVAHFRTPGRHLRFRPDAVLEFLKAYGYTVPAVVVEAQASAAA